MTSAIVFPALSPVRRRDLGTFLMISPYARQRLAEADDTLGYHLADALADAPEDDYSPPVQVAVLLACLALADWAQQELGADPAYCAGPSFGERAALSWTGALPAADTVRLVDEIARTEQEYFATEHRDVVTHSFTRVPELGELLAGLAWYEISGRLDTDFHMVTLREDELDGFKAAISDAGGYSLYTMRPPAHAALFTGVRDRMEQVYARYELAAPRVPIISYHDGAEITEPDALRTALLDGFVRPIRWLDTIQGLRDRGVDRLWIAGPDTMLAKLRGTTAAFDVELCDLRRALVRPRR
ncbi:ACP S-malonyltransferase [Actinoplanes derwentensis]|uniref:[acyl-carrier-protein] S-malonyltransferase n=1 Tax=Actinoplanes derwentensis TaxID=113562 RepID=A0A1H1YA56_9ACTN|nr:ACP S-malonyltransferase [Actinoplanes derwentensis]GID90263.1 malonyl CoA-acyl carrier protein transacylase [Actinoplanes derwentensis]SDT18340.1 [acyl-carrier-protein] S-malonyltransferase [Actinoplanes derwentensis]